MLLIQNIIRNATIYRNKPATIMSDRVRTWSEFTSRVARAAAGLQAMGVARGDRVGILALNSDRYLEALMAVNWAGAIVVPMNIRWSLEEHVYAAKESGIKVLITDDRFKDDAIVIRLRLSGEVGIDLGLVEFCDGLPADGFESWDVLVNDNQWVRNADLPYNSLAGIFYTGGTTGFPKGAAISHMALWSSGVTGVAEMLIPDDTIYLHAAPMFHLADMALSNCTTIAGGSHVFIPAFTPAGVLKAITDRNCTMTLLVPTMIRMLLHATEFADADVSSLRSLVYGASPMPEPILVKALKEMPHVGFYQAYGQTEMAPLVTLLPPENHVLEGPNSKLRSAGRPVGCVQVRIMVEDGKQAECGTPGEIWVRGPNAMDGYWNNPEQSASTKVDGWIKTGDIAYQDVDGFLYICDRAKDMIITGGENVFSAEVESAVSSHHKVSEVAVIGVPDDQYGERVHAIIVPTPNAGQITQEDIYNHCHKLIAGYKCPRSIEVRNEPLPLSGAGKVLKKDLRAPHWQGCDKTELLPRRPSTDMSC